MDGYKWSTPFSVCNEGIMRIFLRKDTGNDQLQLRIGVRSGAKNSSLEVIFRPNSALSPYRSQFIMTETSHFNFNHDKVVEIILGDVDE